MMLLWVVLLVSASERTARAQVTEQDSLALVALYTATDGPSWTDNTNWLTTPVSEWNGVTVTGDRVTELRLGNHGLTGEIPVELGNLTGLTFLNLSDNGLTGEIPVELGNLTGLTLLFLASNGLTGEIPVELGNLTGLFSLSLANNELAGEIPVELGNLTGLTFLGLDRNGLTGEIPVELGNLTNLTQLWLFNNGLTGEIPVELGNLAGLTDLRLHATALSGTLPLSLTNLSMLGTFWFNNTDLCEPTDPAFQAWLQGIADVQSTGCTNVATEDDAEIPTDFALESNYPNPATRPLERVGYIQGNLQTLIDAGEARWTGC